MNKNFKDQVLNIILKNIANIARDISYLYLNQNTKNLTNNKNKEPKEKEEL